MGCKGMESSVINKRIDIGENNKMLLFTEVDGICPICTKKLMYKKKNKTYKNFEVAHIYPLNPTKPEEKLLFGLEKLSEDRNSLDNLIALCPDCHTKFDKPRIKEEYLKVVNLKKRLISKTKLANLISENLIEDNITVILEKLIEVRSEDIELQFDTKKVDEKLDNTIFPLTKLNIKKDVNMYYKFIRIKLKELDAINEGVFEVIACQVRLCYLQMRKDNGNQEEIYNNLSRWLYKTTQEVSFDACKIIISFFIQNCEVF